MNEIIKFAGHLEAGDTILSDSFDINGMATTRAYRVAKVTLSPRKVRFTYQDGQTVRAHTVLVDTPLRVQA